MYESTLTFYDLTIEDAGDYICRASINPVGASQYVLMSGTGSGSESISVQCEFLSVFQVNLWWPGSVLNFLFKAVCMNVLLHSIAERTYLYR